MISKAEYLYLKVRRDKLKNSIAEYKAKNQEYLSLMNIYKLGLLEREGLQNDWKQYYKDCKEGYRGQTFWGLRNVVSEDQKGKSKRLISKEKLDELKAYIKERTQDPQWLENIPQPKMQDETYLFYRTEGFRMGVTKLAEFEKTIETYSSVYERKNSDSYDM